MKYELNTKLLNLDGTEIKTPEGGAVTFKTVAIACLVQAQDREAEDKVAAFRLAVKLECATATVELEAEEVTRLKRLIGAAMPVVIVGRMFNLLEHK